MGLLFWLLCCGIVSLLQAQCPTEYCTCTGKRVYCHGNSIENITALVPNDTETYIYTGFEMNIQLGHVNFSHLHQLTTLGINTEYDDYVFSRTLVFNATNQGIFKPLSKLEHLMISIEWSLTEPLREMFSYLPNLVTLNLTFTRNINYTSLRDSFDGFKNNTKLNTLVMKNTQTFETLQNGMRLNLSDFLAPLANCPLKALDLSYNSLKIVDPGLIRYAPNLTELNMTNNLLTPLVSAFFIEVFIHPNIKTADFRRQGHGINPPNVPTTTTKKPHLTESNDIPSLRKARGHAGTIFHDIPSVRKARGNAGTIFQNPQPYLQPSESNNRLSRSILTKEKPFRLNGIFSKDNTSWCIDHIRESACNIFDPRCIIVYEYFQENHTAFCEVLHTVFKDKYAGIPCEFLPNITTLLARKSECGECLRFPSTGSIEQLHLSENIYYDQRTLPPELINTTKCFHPNKIKYLGLSNNYPFGFPDFDKTLLEPITGFLNLQKLELVNDGLAYLYYNLTASFPSLTELDMSKNKLKLDGNKTQHHFIGPPTVRVFRLSANELKTTPENTLKSMKALEELYLDNNKLHGFSMNLTWLPKLYVLDLQENFISSIPKNMTDQFDAHAQQINRTVKINLNGNPLLCTCNERDFIHWLLNDKHHHLEFVDIDRYTCINDKSDIIKVVHVNLQDMTLHCLSMYVYVGASTGAGLILAGMIVACVTCLYRKRWWFRYRYYVLTRLHRQQQQREEAARNYEYDAFVSYNCRDELWIQEELQPKLENEYGLKLCLHERDFRLGANIVEQISSSIENSRKTLLILSPNFLASTWCHWEMNFAHTHLLESGQDVLLLAILRPMSKVKMSRVLKDLLEKKTYVMWTEDRDGQKLFWEKLHQAIRAERQRPYDLEDGHSWEDTQPLVQPQSQAT